MQVGTELVLFSNVAIIVISLIVGSYLIRLWHSQANRLITDLPLVFAISVISNAFNMLMIILPLVGDFTPSMEYFRLRTMVIGGSVIPILGAMIQIWLPSRKKYHNRLLLLFLAYWTSIALLGPTQDFIMMMCIPLLLLSGVIIGVTFIITWKTGRLKEVRSDIMIVSVIASMGSQVLRVSLAATPLFYIPDFLLMISFVIIGLGFAIPHRTRKREAERKTQPQVQQDLDVTVSV